MPIHPSVSSRPSTTPRLSIKRLLPRTLMAAALIGGAGAVLSAGSAEAATGCGVAISWAAWVGGQDLTCEDKVFKWLSTATVGDLASSTVAAVKPLPEDYLFSLDFGPRNFVSNPFDFSYMASIVDSGAAFSNVDLDSDAVANADPPSILNATFTFSGANSPIELTSTNGSPDLKDVLGHPTTMTVRNQYLGGGAINAFENSFQQVDHVPGPLPVLGAGVAFGFSRKLRRRIDGARAKA